MDAVKKKKIQLSGHTILGLCPTNSAQTLVLGKAIPLAFLNFKNWALHRYSSDCTLCVYRFPHNHTGLMSVRPTRPTMPGHFSCVLVIKATNAREF